VGGSALTATSSVAITVTPVNDAPIMDAGGTLTTNGATGVNEVVTVSFLPTSVATALVFNSHASIALTAGMSAQQIAATFAAQSFTDWSVADNLNGTVTLTARAPGAMANLNALSFTTDGSTGSPLVVTPAGNDYTTTFKPRGAEVAVVAPGITISDVDSADTLLSATVTLATGAKDNEHGTIYETLHSTSGSSYVGATTLAITGNGTGTGGLTGATVLTFSGAGSHTDYQNALKTVLYNNANPNAFAGDRTITFSVTDAASLASNSASITTSAANTAVVVGQRIYVGGVDSLQTVAEVIDSSHFVASGPLTGLTATSSLAFYFAGAQVTTATMAAPIVTTTTLLVPWTPVVDMNGSSGAVADHVAGYGRDHYVTYTEGALLTTGTAVAVATSDAAIADQGGLIRTVTATLTNHPDGASETLIVSSSVASLLLTLGITVNGLGSVSGNINAQTIVFNAAAGTDATNFQVALRALRYSNSSQNADLTNRVVTVSTLDVDGNIGISADSIITLVRVNDAPDITNGPDTAALTETNTTLATSGTLTVTDVDTTDVVTASVSVDSLVISGTSNRSDLLAPDDAALKAMLQVSPATILDDTQITNTLNWSFNSGSQYFNYLATGETLILTYTVKAIDNNGTPLSDTETVTITITGTNDAPTITDGPDSAALTETNAALAATGTLTVTDVDTSDVVTASVSSVVVSGTANAAAAPANDALKALLTVSPTTIVDGTHNSATLNWSFASGTEYFNYLATGETLILTYSVKAVDDDGTPLNDTETVTVTITGSNDAPIIAAIAQNNLDEQSTSSNLVQSITASFGDVDLHDTGHTASITVVAATGVTTGLNLLDTTALKALISFGAVTKVDGSSSGSVPMTFTAASTAFDYLAAGEVATLTYTLTVEDGDGGTHSQTFAVQITGTNDAPLVSAGDVTGGDSELSGTTVGNLTYTGVITFTDVDLTDVHTVTVVNVGTPLGALVAVKNSDTTITGTGGELTWTYTVADSAVEYLKAGETRVEQFTVTVDDGHSGVVNRTVSVTITGANDAPIIASIAQTDLSEQSDTNNLVSAITASFGDVDLADIGHTASITDVTTAGTSGLALGTAALKTLISFGEVTKASGSASGSIPMTFTAASTVFDYLATGEVVTLTYTVAVDDHDGGTHSQTFAVQITGTNDAPVITNGPDTASISETNAELTTSGALTVTDVDITDLVTASVAGLVVSGTSNRSDAVAPTNEALFAMLTVTPTAILSGTETTKTLDWNFTSGTEYFNYLAAGESLVLTYTVKATDDNVTPANDTETVTITITGTNDAPVITGGPDSAALTETNAALATSGTLTVTDVDTTDVVTASVDSLAVSGTSNRSDAAAPGDIALKAMLTVTPTAILGGTETTKTLDWSFASASEHFNYLAAGETLILTYTVKAADDNGSPASATETVTITITGTNDAPVITNGPDSAALTETNAALAATGTLTVTDVDTSDVVTASVDSLVVSGSSNRSNAVAPSDATLLGMLALTPTAFVDGTHNSATLTWNFSSGSEYFNYLAAGETLVLTYTVKAVDDDGALASDTETVTITITGTNDAPVIDLNGGIAGIDGSAVFNPRGPHVALFDSTMTIVDVDNANYLTSAQLVMDPTRTVDNFNDIIYETLSTTLAGGVYTSGAVTLTFTGNGSGAGNLTDATHLTLTGNGSAADYKAALLTVCYNNTNDGAFAGVRPVSVTLYDSTNAPNSPVATLSVNVNWGPVTDLSGESAAGRDYTVSFTEGATGVAIAASDAALVDQDGNIKSVTVALGNYEDGNLEKLFITQEQLNTFTGSGVTVTGNNSHTITLTGNQDSTYFQDALRAIQYTNTSQNPNTTPRLITVNPIDMQDHVGVGATTTINPVRVNDAPTGTVTITNTTSGSRGLATAQQNDVLSASNTLADVDGIGTITYQWLRAGVDVAGATGATYTLIQADVGNAMTVKATYTDGGGTVENVSSGATNAVINVNDAPVVEATDVTGAVTELVTATGNLTDSGTINFSDIDFTDTHSVSTAVPSASALGTLTASVTHEASTATGNIAGVVTWNYSVAASAVEYLALGETKVETFSFNVLDGQGGSITRTVDVTITGTNDVPTVVADAGATTENATLTISAANGVLSNDTDLDTTDTHTVSAVNDVAGNVANGVTGSHGGTFTIAADGSYTFNPGTAFDYLAQAETQTTSVTYTNLDSHGLSASNTLTVTVTGTNDTPVAIAATSSATEDATAVTGSVTSTDLDVTGKTATYTLDTAVAGLTLDANGSYSFDPGNAAYQYLAKDEHHSVVANYTVTDDQGAHTGSTLTIDVTGTNDVPVIGGVSTGTVSEAGHLDTGMAVLNDMGLDGLTHITGTLSSSDVDNGATHAWALQGTPSSTYGTIALDSASGVWSYSLNNLLPATQALKEGEVATESYTARVTDDKGGYAEQTISITIHGTNDVPAVANDATALVGTVTEAGYLVAGTAVAHGTLIVADVDTDATQVWSLVGAPSTAYGTMAIAADSGVWTYNLNNDLAASQALAAGETITQTYTARATDDKDAFVNQFVTVTIVGSNDKTVISGTSTAAVDETNAPITATGTLIASDPDSSNAFVARTDVVGSNGLGKFSITTAGVWTYTADSAHNDFVAGSSHADSITVATADGTTQVVTVTIAATNDAAVISGTSSASLTETNAVLTATGELSATDIDSATTFVARTNVAGSNGYGRFNIGTNGVWDYATTTAYNEFAGGLTYSESIVVATADGTQQTISVTIAGTNDAPVVTGVPDTVQAVSAGKAGDLANFGVSDAEAGSLSVTLTPTNGAINGLTDVDPNSGIQLTGTAAQINAALAAATFTAAAVGDAGIAIVVTDAGHATAGATYHLTADNAGVLPTVEAQVPSLPLIGGGTTVAGDGNGDGVADNQQLAVTSTPFLDTSTAISSFVTLVADSIAGVVDTTDVGSALLTNIQQLDAPVDLPSAMLMPLGELSFSAVVDTKGVSETFSLFVDSSVNVNGYWSLNSDGIWVNLATHIETVGDKTRIDFAITDGGVYDNDPTPDGVITDNGAVGSMPLSIVGTVPVTHGGFFF